MDAESVFDSLIRETMDAWHEPASEIPPTLSQRLRLLARRMRRLALAVVYLARHTLGDWMGHHAGPLGRAAEAFAWPAALLGLCWMANPANPFFIGEPFPWPWLGPWMIALRYGVGWGMGATFGLLCAWAVLAPTASVAAFPRLYFLGGAITTLVAGEFGGYWRLRILRLEESLRFLGDKAERLTRRLYLLKLSHDELEHELVDRPGTLREALTDLRRMLDSMVRRHPQAPAELPGAQLVLDFVVNHCRVESAAIYRLDAQGQLDTAAKVGRMVTPDRQDPMIVRALESGHQVHLQDALLEKVQRSSLVAATPLMAADGTAMGIMLIGNMPFTALTSENLQTVAVLLENYADYLRGTDNARELAHEWPAAPPDLAGEFAWLSRMRDEHGLESYCAVWRVRYLEADELLDTIMSLHSRGESAWRWPRADSGQRGQRGQPGTDCVIALVPFTDHTGFRIYRQRVIDAVLESNESVFPRQLTCTALPLGGEGKFAELRAIVEGGK